MKNFVLLSVLFGQLFILKVAYAQERSHIFEYNFDNSNQRHATRVAGHIYDSEREVYVINANDYSPNPSKFQQLLFEVNATMDTSNVTLFDYERRYGGRLMSIIQEEKTIFSGIRGDYDPDTDTWQCYVRLYEYTDVGDTINRYNIQTQEGWEVRSASILYETSNSIFLYGHIKQAPGSYGVFIHQLDSNFNLIQETFTAIGNQPRSNPELQVDKRGGYYMTYATYYGLPGAYGTLHLLRLNSSLAVVESTPIMASYYHAREFVWGNVRQDDNNNYYLNWHTTYVAEDAPNNTLPDTFANPLTVVKLDSNYNMLWEYVDFRPEERWPEELILTDSGNVVLIGYGTMNWPSEDKNGDVGFALKLTPNGDVRWDRSFKPDAGANGHFSNIEEQDSHFTITGVVYRPPLVGMHGRQYPWFVSLAKDGTWNGHAYPYLMFTSDTTAEEFHPIFEYSLDDTVSLTAIAATSVDISIYPNPAVNTLTLECHDCPLDSNREMSLYTLDGRLIRRQRLTAPKSIINVGGIAVGTYILTYIQDGVVVQSRKFVITQNK